MNSRSGRMPQCLLWRACDSYMWKLVTLLDSICLTSAGMESRVVHSGLGPVKQRNGKHPKSIFFRKKIFIVATKMQTHRFYMASWKTVQFDSSVKSQKTLRRAPRPTPSCIHVYTHLKRCYTKTPRFFCLFLFL